MGNSNLNIDESNLIPTPTIFQRTKNILGAIVLGAVLVQVFFFYGAVKSGSFTPVSIIIYIDNIYFIGYLVFFGIMGGVKGQDFLDWLKVKIGEWNFW